MELNKEQLYDAFGELLYAVAMVDGEVQEAEAKRIEELLTGHPAAAEIEWSFAYEFEKKQTVNDAYKKALDICKYYGPCPDYPFLIDALKKVAESVNGLSEEEKQIIDNFQNELREHFIKNIPTEE